MAGTLFDEPLPAHWQRNFPVVDPAERRVADELVCELYYQLYEDFGLSENGPVEGTSLVFAEHSRDDPCRKSHWALRSALGDTDVFTLHVGTELPEGMAVRHEFHSEETARTGLRALERSFVMGEKRWKWTRQQVKAAADAVSEPVQVGMTCL